MLKLNCQVGQHPCKRLLQDINRFVEEVTIIQYTMGEQHKIVRYPAKICDPYTFRTSTQRCFAMFEIEDRLFTTSLEGIRRNGENLQKPISSTRRLAEQAEESVEIQQEAHSKVIVVFATVAIVFLPLSIVTSLLGMNTVDIRNSDSSQALFWAIALPLTAVVFALSLLVGYKGPEIREAFGNPEEIS